MDHKGRLRSLPGKCTWAMFRSVVTTSPGLNALTALFKGSPLDWPQTQKCLRISW